MTETGLVTPESVERAIIVLRGRRVILDSELAALYGVTVSVFNQAVKRNMERFPADFAFQLTREEYESLRSQIVILKAGRGAHRIAHGHRPQPASDRNQANSLLRP